MVKECLADEVVVPSALCQHCIDWNRDVLKRELALDDEDIIDLPILFKLVAREDEEECRAVAYYPDMVRSDILCCDGCFQFKRHECTRQ